MSLVIDMVWCSLQGVPGHEWTGLEKVNNRDSAEWCEMLLDVCRRQPSN